MNTSRPQQCPEHLPGLRRSVRKHTLLGGEPSPDFGHHRIERKIPSRSVHAGAPDGRFDSNQALLPLTHRHEQRDERLA